MSVSSVDQENGGGHLLVYPAIGLRIGRLEPQLPVGNGMLTPSFSSASRMNLKRSY